MSELNLFDQLIRELESNRPTSHLIDTIDKTLPLGLSYSHIYHSIRASKLIGELMVVGYWKWAERYQMNMYLER